MWRDKALLLDMLLAAQDAREFASGLDVEAFKQSKLHQCNTLELLWSFQQTEMNKDRLTRIDHQTDR